ncbi:hypothetical protein [Sphingobium scionense]|uniref:Uncharacterized protein n=1 Tax=Sphingobium scionense TaxID=1404341 RepID=A0A7W6LTP7_9SPHN|nr:hypothetical protein [Sphingobium scionense]MBB4149257.1 hypothetical protein [Sphingobium scionense]
MEAIELAAHPAPTLNSNWFDTGPAANQRFLDEPELCLWLRALAPEPLDVRRALLLPLLTAARRGVLFGASACEFSNWLWTLPADRSKNGETNFVALGAWGRFLAQTNARWLIPSPRVDAIGAQGRAHQVAHGDIGRPGPQCYSIGCRALHPHQPIVSARPEFEIDQMLVIDDDQQVIIGFIAAHRVIHPAATRIGAVEHDLQATRLFVPFLVTSSLGLLKLFEEHTHSMREFTLFGRRQEIEVGPHFSF